MTPRLIRVTQPEDGPFHPRFYSYWSPAWVTGDHAIVVAGHVDGRARFFQVDLRTGDVVPLGMLIPSMTGTTEGWFFNSEGLISLCDGPRLWRVNPFRPDDPGTILDISETHPGCMLWQAHSSDDGEVHSATIKDGAYQHIGTVLGRDGGQTFFPAQGVLDESQVTRDGAYLVIKEDDDNRIVTVATGEERILTDAQGAVGHSDCGDSIVVGEDNIRGACVLWDLRAPLTEPSVLFATWNLGYVSVRGGRCLHSGDTHVSLVSLDGSGVEPLVEHGGSADYDGRVKAALSPCGTVATYMANGVVYLLVL